ncbi:hypothetical protein [Nocardia australiensis]|uniref:hypothetical protein n=1 Tax=Nocardia australiensis TaxID=2887191 RepID=UPI001D14963B|nr:hypothetical protein [Nocardia australiensis]
MHQIAGWWDGFELWVAGLPFIPQFAVVLVGMVPVSFAIAYALDRILRAVMRMLDRRHAPTNPGAHDDLPAAGVETRETVQSGAH